jgi:ADP-ribosylglycohydrolase
MDNKIYMIINGLIGDIYGSPIEMMSLEIIHRKYGSILKDYIITERNKDRLYEYTDDSEMTLSVLDFLNNKKFNNETMLSFYIKHFEPFRGYSSNTYNSFVNYISNKEIKCYNRITNGGIMRISPLLFLYNENNEEEILDLIKIIHYPTHVNEEAIYTSFIYIKILYIFYTLKDSLNKKKDILKNLKLLNEKYGKYNIKKKIDFIFLNLDNDEYEIVHELLDIDGILCYETLSTALWCIIKNIDILDPKDILAKGICYGGDCDTIGSIIGQMTGILFGELAINKDWFNTIDSKKFIDLSLKLI